jgi:hypothetical protein
MILVAFDGTPKASALPRGLQCVLQTCLQSMSSRSPAGHDRMRAMAPPNPEHKGDRMSLPRIVSRDEWLVARKQLLSKLPELHRGYR